ncbi:glycosyltransferase family 4 protein [Phormidium sp. LEGE 05292]|uniref:glycosyltransferase family 4 protein n=1 Tax=[Phormidium] sp. LEGE 05292 TaxID=767427 RepID=UPI001881B59B|nr:glycosyltransferase family 4 protein [Phormidium sp. LEGE 05292]MBE9224080.1 glycosyltransferase family 4 protein [Phormidium sp. LEGE 05292]
MRILLFLYYPFHPHNLAGGAQTLLWLQIKALIKLGFNFRILCPYCDEKGIVDNTHIEIFPVLSEVTVTDPSPEGQASNLKVIVQLLEGIDLVWTVDRKFPLVIEQPIMLTFTTQCLYPDECAALFDGNWDMLLLLSDFSRRSIEKWLPHIHSLRKRPRIEVVPAPFDPQLSIHSDSGSFQKLVGQNNTKLRYILFPHRPEPGKGHEEALEVLKELIKYDPMYHLLVPEPPISRKFDVDQESRFINFIKSKVSELDLNENVTFHKWIPRNHLYSYYSSGECCLFLSMFPETLGLSLIDSLLCKTFVISHGVGALSETVPPGYGHIVIPERDPVKIAQAIVDGSSLKEIELGYNFIRTQYNPIEIGKRLATLFYSVTKSDWLLLGNQRLTDNENKS